MDWSAADIAIVLTLMFVSFVAGWVCRSWLINFTSTLPDTEHEMTRPTPMKEGSVYEGVVTWGPEDALLRLYKLEDGKVLYWEADAGFGELSVRSGTVGLESEQVFTSLPKSTPAKDVVLAAAEEWRARGYSELPAEKQAILVVDCDRNQYGGPDPASDLSDVITETFAPRGLGHVDDTELDADRVKALCHVVDERLASAPLLDALRSGGFLEGSRVTSERDGKVTVHWPAEN